LGPTSAATVLQNTWTHVAISGARSGNAQIYINGVASGAAVSIAGVGNSVQPSYDLIFAMVNSVYYNYILGAARLSLYGASGLPASVAAIISQNFSAERAIFGV
jgi:hypothetical protein